MHSLPDWEKRFPKIPQHGPFWCIPASIENILRYSGFDALTQEDLILGYCRRFGEDGLLKIVSHAPPQAVPVSIRGLSDGAILQLAKQCAFRHGNFETFAEPVQKNGAFQKAKLSLNYIGSIPAKSDYFTGMTNAIKANCPVLISVDNLNKTAHIQAVVEVQPDRFKAYDPALHKIAEYSLANCVFGPDLLVLKPSP